MNEKEARERHSRHSTPLANSARGRKNRRSAEGFREDGGITGFEVAVVEDVHVVLNHGNLPHEVAHFTFVEFGGESMARFLA